MIKDSDKKQFELILMYAIDRFARNRNDAALYKVKLKKNGVKLIFATQPMPDTPESIILEALMEGLSEYYSENLARGVKRGLKENALAGVSVGGAAMCLGYRVGADKKYEIDPVGAKAVRIIFEMYADGKKASEIVSYLNEQGYKTRLGKPFNKNSLPRILRNDRYTGIYKFDDVVVEGGIPAIISKELFDKVQAKLHHNYRTKASGKAREDYLLSSKLFCGHCGALMVGECGTSRGKTYHYYKCNGRKYGRKCSKKTVRKEWIEQLVVKFTIENVLTDEIIEAIATKVMILIEKELSDDTILKSLRSQLKDVRKRKDNLIKAIEQGVITPTTKNRLTELENEEYDIETKISREKMKKPSLTKERIIYWLSSFRDGNIKDIEYQRTIIDTLVNSVFLYDTDGGDRKLVIAYNISGDNTRTLCCSDIECYASPGFSMDEWLLQSHSSCFWSFSAKNHRLRRWNKKL